MPFYEKFLEKVALLEKKYVILHQIYARNKQINK